MTSLLTLKEYREHFGLTSTGTDAAEDTQLSTLIKVCSNYIGKYCNRQDNFTDYTDTDFIQYDKGDWHTLDMELYPLISVTEVAFSPDRGLTWEVLVENTDYIVLLESDSIVTVSGEPFCARGRTRAIRMTYKAGFTEIPADLKLACALMVQFYFKNEYTAQKELGGDSVRHSGFTIEDKEWPAHIKRLLDLYRDVRIHEV